MLVAAAGVGLLNFNSPLDKVNYFFRVEVKRHEAGFQMIPAGLINMHSVWLDKA